MPCDGFDKASWKPSALNIHKKRTEGLKEFVVKFYGVNQTFEKVLLAKA